MEVTKPLMNRRSFLRLSGMLGIGMAATGIFPATSEAIKFNRRLYKVSKTRLAMGTFVSMTLIDPSKDKAEKAIDQAFGEIDRLTRLMSRFDSITAISQLNSEGTLRDVPPEVLEIMVKSLDYYHVTDGNFDISIKPVVDLFKESFARHANVPPSEAEIQKALLSVGSDAIHIGKKEIRFKKPGMGITLDGIAKGYIVDKASKVLAKQNIENYLINAGGDIRARGVRKDQRPWTIAIQDPHKNRQYPDIISLRDGAIATSGNYEVYFDREKMFHHIVNPKTGHSPHSTTSVSILAKTTMDADALSTSVFIMAPRAGIKFIESLHGRECLVINKSGKVLKSSGWKSAAV